MASMSITFANEPESSRNSLTDTFFVRPARVQESFSRPLAMTAAGMTAIESAMKLVCGYEQTFTGYNRKSTHRFYP